MSRPIRILDDKDQEVGQLMTASDTDILKYIAKGFRVVDTKTGETIMESDVSASLGVSDGAIVME